VTVLVYMLYAYVECLLSVHSERVARHVIETWYASCVVGESYPIKLCARRGYCRVANLSQKKRPYKNVVVVKAMYYSTRGRKLFKYMEGGSKHLCSFVTWPMLHDTQLHYLPLKGELPLFTYLTYKILTL